MLQLTVNGEAKELDSAMILAEALPIWGFEGRHFAVAVNGSFVPKSQYDSFQLQGGEALEILSPRQGG